MSLMSEIKLLIVETEKLLREFKTCVELDYVKKKRLKKYKMKLINMLENIEECANDE